MASSYPKDAVVADPDQPVISASPASAQGVIPPVPFTAVGCAVRWLAERRPDPHNCERDHDEDRDDNLAPHVATITTAEGSDGDGGVAIRLFGCMSLRLSMQRQSGRRRRSLFQNVHSQWGWHRGYGGPCTVRG